MENVKMANTMIAILRGLLHIFYTFFHEPSFKMSISCSIAVPSMVMIISLNGINIYVHSGDVLSDDEVEHADDLSFYMCRCAKFCQALDVE